MSSSYLNSWDLLRYSSHQWSEAKNPNIVWLRTPNTLHIHLPVNVKDVCRCITRPDRLGGMSELDTPLPLTADGYDLWEIQALLAMRTDKKTNHKTVLGVVSGVRG